MPNDPIEQKVWNAVKTRIKDSVTGTGTILEYVGNNSFFDGYRENVPSGAFPIILMEPGPGEEANHSAPNRILLTMRINITVAIEHMDLDKQIVGDGTTRGILDLINDVKNVVLGGDLAVPDAKLGLASSGVLRIRFPNHTPEIDLDNYPLRIALIEAQIEATTTLAGR